MNRTKHYRLELPSDYNAQNAASFIAQLDNLSERMFRDTKDLQKVDLMWQQAPGMNSIGMLLAHIAIVEVYWVKRVLLQDIEAEAHVEQILGIAGTMDGIPLSQDGTPPPVLVRNIEFFNDLHSRARSFTKKITQELTDSEMERDFDISSESEDSLSTATPCWTLYHILEHQAGHYGQILLIKHQMNRNAQAKQA